MKKLINLIPIVLLLIASNFPFVNTQSITDTSVNTETAINSNRTLNELMPGANQSITAEFINEIQSVENISEIELEELTAIEDADLWSTASEAAIETQNWMLSPEEWLASK